MCRTDSSMPSNIETMPCLGVRRRGFAATKRAAWLQFFRVSNIPPALHQHYVIHSLFCTLSKSFQSPQCFRLTHLHNAWLSTHLRRSFQLNGPGSWQQWDGHCILILDFGSFTHRHIGLVFGQKIEIFKLKFSNLPQLWRRVRHTQRL